MSSNFFGTKIEIGICTMTINHRIHTTNGNQYINPNLNNDLKIDKNIDHNSELLKLTFAEKKIVELTAQHKAS